MFKVFLACLAVPAVAHAAASKAKEMPPRRGHVEVFAHVPLEMGLSVDFYLASQLVVGVAAIEGNGGRASGHDSPVSGLNRTEVRIERQERGIAAFAEWYMRSSIEDSVFGGGGLALHLRSQEAESSVTSLGMAGSSTESYTDRQYYLTPFVRGGYRLIWRSGVTFAVFAIAQLSLGDKDWDGGRSASPAFDEAIRKLAEDDGAGQFLAAGISVGYAF